MIFRMSETRYYFNKDERQCQSFTWGGCNDMGNNFASLDDCKTMCNISSECPDFQGCDLECEHGYDSVIFRIFSIHKGMKSS